MNRGVYMSDGSDEWYLGTVLEVLDPEVGFEIPEFTAVRELWMTAGDIVSRLVYGEEEDTTAILTIEIR